MIQKQILVFVSYGQLVYPGRGHNTCNLKAIDENCSVLTKLCTAMISTQLTQNLQLDYFNNLFIKINYII